MRYCLSVRSIVQPHAGLQQSWSEAWGDYEVVRTLTVFLMD